MTREGNKVAKKTKKKYRIDYVRVLLIVCVVYFSITFVKQQLEINEYNVKINSVKEDITLAQEGIESLNETKNKTNDAEYIEKIAREEFGLVKPYEKVFIDVSK